MPAYMRRFYLALAGLALVAQAAAADPTPTPAGAFKTLYQAEWKWRADQTGEDDSPIKPGGHLPDVSPKAQGERLKYWLSVRDQLRRIDSRKLSDADQVNYQVYQAQIDTLIDAQTFRDYEKPLTSDSAFWSDMAAYVRTSYRTEAEYRDYIAQLGEIGRYFDQNIANMRLGLKRGFTPPRITLKGREGSVKKIFDVKSADNSPFYTPFRNMPATIPADVQAQLKSEGARVIMGSVIPAYKKLYDFLVTDYIPKAQPLLAAWDLPDGKAYYQAQIRAYTTLDMQPDAIHQLGLTEVAAIRAQMQKILIEVKYQGDLASFLTYLRHDPQFYARTPDELLMRTAWVAKRFDGKAKDWFGHLPRARFGIVPVPDAIAPYYTSGRGGPGVYLVNTYDLPSRPLYSMPALTLHESAPGHALQMSLANENKDLTDLRRNTYISAYGEGWALYCEKLGLEMGMYETPYERFGMLSYQMWRAARLVVDTGIHTQGWSREQAQAYMRDNTALSEHEIETEVDRYIGWPGQALSYYLGEKTIDEGRARAEAALGSKFNIRAFHDAVLELGGVPLPVVTARIDRFIAEGGKGPYPDEEQ